MNNLCSYKKLFGNPNTGPHSYRIFNIAIVDLALTILLALFISSLFKYSFTITTIILLLLGILLHRLLCVRTTIDKLLFTL